MSRRAIVEYPDERLRTIARPVACFDDKLGRLVDDLIDTLAGTDGLGLSAPQLGHAERVVILKGGPEEPWQVFVNPHLSSSAGFAITLESCLSLPGVRANVLRASQVQVNAFDRSGDRFERVLTGFPAVCLQHELDHLDGRLFIDRVSWPRRWLLRTRLAELVARNETAAPGGHRAARPVSSRVQPTRSPPWPPS